MTSIFHFHQRFLNIQSTQASAKNKSKWGKNTNWNKLKGREMNFLVSLTFFVTFGGLRKAIFICLLRLHQTLCSAPFVQLSISVNPLWMLTTARAFYLHRQYLTLSVKGTEAIWRPESITLFSIVRCTSGRHVVAFVPCKQRNTTHPFVLQSFPSLFSPLLPG